MRKTMGIVEDAFMQGIPKKSGNSQTDGQILLLFGNRIAEWREDGLWITDCGWLTPTTRNHLNKLPNVSVCQIKRLHYLNGELWDGSWTKVLNQTPPKVKENGRAIFDTTMKYVKTDGWRGYHEPVYAVCGANNTGMWSDSPCRTDVCLRELDGAIKALKGIPIKRMTCASSNVFCVHEYVIVPPDHVEKARKIIEQYYETVRDSVKLLYPVY